MDLVSIYTLNLLLTIAMFFVLIFRAWIEFKNYKILWKEMEYLKNRQLAQEILITEKETFYNSKEGKELYEILKACFQIKEKN